MPKPKGGSDVIAASEISQYAYCPVSWHLLRSGVAMQSDGLSRGIAEHKRAGCRLRLIKQKERAASRFGLIALLFASAAVLLLGWILWTRL
jgi:hypothetical protein